MKKILLALIITFFFTKCESNNRRKKLNENFQKCYESNIQKLLEKDIWITKDKLSAGERIYNLYEEYLLRKGLLKSVEKESYVYLLRKAKKGISNDFSKEIEFNTEGFFPGWTILNCQDELYRKEILKEDDWQFKLAKEIAEYQANGNIENLKNAINIIPENEFTKIYYRNEIINLIYNMNLKY